MLKLTTFIHYEITIRAYANCIVVCAVWMRRWQLHGATKTTEFFRKNKLLIKFNFHIKVNKSGTCRNLGPQRIPWGNFRGNRSCWGSIFFVISIFCLHRAQADNGRVTSVIWYAGWTLTLFVICNDRSGQDASDPEKCCLNTANRDVSSRKSMRWQSDK